MLEMINKLVVSLGLVWVLVFSCTPDFESRFTPSSATTVNVIATDEYGNSLTGDKRAGFTVSLSDKTATTDTAGKVAFSSVPAGEFNLSVSKSGFVTNTRKIKMNGTGEILQISIGAEVNTEIDTIFFKPIYPFTTKRDTSGKIDTIYDPVAQVRVYYKLKQSTSMISNRYIRLFWGGANVDNRNFEYSIKLPLSGMPTSGVYRTISTEAPPFAHSFAVPTEVYFIAYPIHPFDTRYFETPLESKIYENIRADKPSQRVKVVFEDK